MTSTVAFRHPGADLRARIRANDVRARPSILDRIVGSYAHVDGVLEHCPDLDRGAAYDVGSGPGHESFALGAHFDSVIAVDNSRRAIAEASRIARATAVRHVRFAVRDAETYLAPAPVDLVFCNVMSHNLRSRAALLERLRSSMAEGSWLFYSEECEGYGPLEIHRAIVRRDARALRERVRQILTGILGRPEFRFFLSGTVEKDLRRLGLEQVRREQETWNSLTYLERSWARATRRPDASTHSDRDYAELPAELAELRGRCRDLLRERSRAGFAQRQVEAIGDLARAAPNRLAPFALFLLVADAVPGAFSARPSLRERASHVLPLARRHARRIDWPRVAELDAEFIALIRDRAGLKGPVED